MMEDGLDAVDPSKKIVAGFQAQVGRQVAPELAQIGPKIHKQDAKFQAKKCRVKLCSTEHCHARPHCPVRLGPLKESKILESKVLNPHQAQEKGNTPGTLSR